MSVISHVNSYNETRSILAYMRARPDVGISYILAHEVHNRRKIPMVSWVPVHELEAM